MQMVETITVSSRVIVVPDAAKIVDALEAPLTFADITVGKRVHVTGNTVGAVTTASIVRVLDFAVVGAVSGLTGGCSLLTFTVDGTDVATTATTEFAGGGCDRLADAMQVEVRGVLDAGVLTASRVQLPKNIPPKNPAKNVRVKGTITAFEDASCPTKTFTVAGKEVRSNTSTLFTGSGKCAAIAACGGEGLDRRRSPPPLVLSRPYPNFSGQPSQTKRALRESDAEYLELPEDRKPITHKRDCRPP
jgi:hypothetical protein